MQKLLDIQKKLKAPKGQFNSFGKYKYRSCEDILEALKPLLDEQGLLLTITDAIEQIGDRYYVKATATLTAFVEKTKDVAGTSGVVAEVSAYAREEESKKGMDGSQVTGAASSYARKYALNGMFLIDDAKDTDTYEEKPEPKKIKEDFALSEEVSTAAKKSGWTPADLSELAKRAGYPSVFDLPVDRAAGMLKFIQENVKNG